MASISGFSSPSDINDFLAELVSRIGDRMITNQQFCEIRSLIGDLPPNASLAETLMEKVPALRSSKPGAVQSSVNTFDKKYSAARSQSRPGYISADERRFLLQPFIGPERQGAKVRQPPKSPAQTELPGQRKRSEPDFFHNSASKSDISIFQKRHLSGQIRAARSELKRAQHSLQLISGTEYHDVEEIFQDLDECKGQISEKDILIEVLESELKKTKRKLAYSDEKYEVAQSKSKEMERENKKNVGTLESEIKRLRAQMEHENKYITRLQNNQFTDSTRLLTAELTALGVPSTKLGEVATACADAFGVEVVGTFPSPPSVSNLKFELSTLNDLCIADALNKKGEGSAVLVQDGSGIGKNKMNNLAYGFNDGTKIVIGAGVVADGTAETVTAATVQRLDDLEKAQALAAQLIPGSSFQTPAKKIAGFALTDGANAARKAGELLAEVAVAEGNPGEKKTGTCSVHGVNLFVNAFDIAAEEQRKANRIEGKSLHKVMDSLHSLMLNPGYGTESTTNKAEDVRSFIEKNHNELSKYFDGIPRKVGSRLWAIVYMWVKVFMLLPALRSYVQTQLVRGWEDMNRSELLVFSVIADSNVFDKELAVSVYLQNAILGPFLLLTEVDKETKRPLLCLGDMSEIVRCLECTFEALESDPVMAVGKNTNFLAYSTLQKYLDRSSFGPGNLVEMESARKILGHKYCLELLKGLAKECKIKLSNNLAHYKGQVVPVLVENECAHGIIVERVAGMLRSEYQSMPNAKTDTIETHVMLRENKTIEFVRKQSPEVQSSIMKHARVAASKKRAAANDRNEEIKKKREQNAAEDLRKATEMREKREALVEESSKDRLATLEIVDAKTGALSYTAAQTLLCKQIKLWAVATGLKKKDKVGKLVTESNSAHLIRLRDILAVLIAAPVVDQAAEMEAKRKKKTPMLPPGYC